MTSHKLLEGGMRSLLPILDKTKSDRASYQKRDRLTKRQNNHLGKKSENCSMF
ncbi:MAG TPA: hypothetical protein V6D14_13795 [Coleofasciculaceae cyanobacterium]